MGILDGIAGAVGVVFDPLLQFPPLLVVITFAFVISLVTVLVYKFLTDQALMKSLKDDMKRAQSEMKTLKNDPQKAMAVQKQAMEANMKYMKHSFKTTFVTLLPVLLIIGWFNLHLAYVPIMPLSEFTMTAVMHPYVSGEVAIEDIVPDGLTVISDTSVPIEDERASFQLKGQEGSYLVTFSYNNKTATRPVLVTTARNYEDPVIKIKDSPFQSLNVAHEKLVLLPIGFRDWFGWLGVYFLASLVFSLLMRKVLNVY